MKFQPFNNKAKLLEERDVSLKEALILLNKYLARSDQVFENGDLAMEQTCFCISRDKRDFLQVNCDGLDIAWFISDRLNYEMNFLLRIFCNKTAMAFGGNREIGIQVISDYFELSRESFEAKYAKGYRNPQQFGYETIT
jgi:hypothetical protein